MKFILFICILSLLSAVVAGTPDENINESKFNISIIVKNIEGHPIENASVEAIYPQGNIVIKNTDSNGTVDLVITCNSKIILWNFILLMLPLFSMLFIIISNKHKYWYVPALSWIIAFIVFHTNNFSIYFFDPVLKVPLYVPIIAFIGAISYVTVSDLKKMEKKLDAEVIKRIHCAYGRRLLMAPYIAIIALFTLSDVINMKNQWAIVFFAYFVGLYTKAIEGTLKELGMKFLTAKQKKEIHNRNIEDFKNSDVSVLSGTSVNINNKLNSAGISKIIDLIAISDEKIEEIAEKIDLDKTFLTGLKEEAKKKVQSLK